MAKKTKSKKTTKTTKTAKSNNDKTEQKNSKSISVRIKEIINNEKYRFLFGFGILFFAVYIAVAFISFLFTWQIDQSKFDLNFLEYFSSDVEVQNWMGKLGAIISKTFIHKWFGFSSVGFIYIFSLLGLRFIKIKINNYKRLITYTLIGIIWGSIALSFLFGDALFYLGGAYGYLFTQWLSGILGKFGTGFVILISALTFVFLTIDESFDWTKNFFKNIVSNKNLKKAFSETNKKIKESIKEKPQKEDDFKFEKLNDDDSIDKANNEKLNDENIDKKERQLVFDLDTNEPLRTVNKNNFILGDNSQEDDLGFEINNTNDEVEQEGKLNIDTEAKKLDDKLNNKHLLEVQKNEDILLENVEQMEDFDPTLELSSFKLPPIELLEDHKATNSEVTNEELLANKNKIVETLANYKIQITKIKATIGPTITLYEIIPAPGVRISKIRNLEDDIALSLAALGIRIIAPMPGRGTIGIEVPNQNPAIVSMKSVISSANFQNTKFDLPIVMGKTISNESYVFDLTKMPHLLVAGATGQGKSVGLNAILTSLLYKKHPSELKFVLIDPKKVELTLYERIEKHYLAKLPDSEEAIITENQKVVLTLNSLNVEMDNRYRMLKDAKVRNIKEYNAKFIARKLNPEKGHGYLPYIVLVIDEFADLIMTAGKEVELPIARIAQLARAIGIHLIVATQRPSTNIITGVIKANFPARIAFKVASMIDSRTILDSPGANQLIGRGDMLMTKGSDLIRMQCAFVDTPELESITEFIGKQRGYSSAFDLPEPELEMEESGPGAVDLSKRDKLFEDSARIIVMNQQGSTSMIQRKLAIGYNRAGRIMDQLEAAGVVGGSQGSKAREVFYQDELSLEQLFKSLDEIHG